MTANTTRGNGLLGMGMQTTIRGIRYNKRIYAQNNERHNERGVGVGCDFYTYADSFKLESKRRVGESGTIL